MATNIFRRAFAPRERYQRPHNYNISVGLTAVCLAPGRQRTPVISFLIQNDLNNAGVINVGDPHVSLLNGVQLDPGRAWVFSIFTGALVTGSLFQTPADFAE
jgi:hypothetical protein